MKILKLMIQALSSQFREFDDIIAYRIAENLFNSEQSSPNR
jgi:hypothetical protein